MALPGGKLRHIETNKLKPFRANQITSCRFEEFSDSVPYGDLELLKSQFIVEQEQIDECDEETDSEVSSFYIFRAHLSRRHNQKNENSEAIPKAARRMNAPKKSPKRK